MSRNTSRRWVVMKFGGTSVSSAVCWETICKRARQTIQSGRHTLIVVSALSGVTDLLTRLGLSGDAGKVHSILAEIEAKHVSLLAELGLERGEVFNRVWLQLAGLAKNDPEQNDPGQDNTLRNALLLSAGEQLSSAIGHQVLQRAGLDLRLQDATQLLEANTGPGDSALSASCDAHSDPELEVRLASEAEAHITQGFLVAGPDGQTWVLGRGGSDTSAACLAARLQAERLEIWTDVPGIFTANPTLVPDARLLQRLSYSEAQELASMGAKILHPPSVRVCKQAGVPISIKDTGRPEIPGTCIGPRSAETDARVKGIVSRAGITLVMMENPSMWRQVGFLADAFERFRRCGLSVDLVSTSESSVTVSLDPSRPGVNDEDVLNNLVEALSLICDVQLRPDCVSISLVGNAIRTILGRLSEALDVFQDRKIHMVTQSANDLNLTLVVDAEHADRLVQNLHRLLISPQIGQNQELGDSWSALTAPGEEAVYSPWWRNESVALERIMQDRSSAYVYHLGSMRQAARRLLDMNAVSRVLYAVKANNHPDILRTLYDEGIGFECVSLAEALHVLDSVSGASVNDILFTPNFADRNEYQHAMALGIPLTIDNPYPLANWPELFAGREVFLRVDLEVGHGHNRKVVTSGARSKFGIAMDQLDDLHLLLKQHEISVTGLHAHTGSGVHDAAVWGEQLRAMLEILPLFPEVQVLDLGGGLGVPDRAGQATLDLRQMDGLLAELTADLGLDIWLEPGRYLVAESGVLMSRITQLKSKGLQHYLGLGTGMNSMIRPALYGAYHEIINLSRQHQPSTRRYTVVGPICESGDVLGEGRYLPESFEGDIMLLANAGAYGRVMSSSYNQRDPAPEFVFETEYASQTQLFRSR